MNKIYVVEALINGKWQGLSVRNTERSARRSKETLEKHLRVGKDSVKLRIVERFKKD